MKINFKKHVVNYMVLAIIISCSIGYGLGLVTKGEPVAPVVIEQIFQDTIQEVLPACVFISVEGHGYSWSGSGVIISPDGEILTAGHVVRNAVSIEVELNDGRKFKATNFHALKDNDGGFINIDPNEPLPYVEYCDSDSLVVGDDVFVIGSPFGHDQINTVTKGIVSHTGRSIEFFGTGEQIQVDAASWPGNSGGPVFNINGELVAILVGGIGGYDDLSLCTPLNLFWERNIDAIVDKCLEWMTD